MKRFLRDKKNLVILLLSILFLMGIPHGGIQFVLWMFTGIIVASSCDFLINKYLLKQKIFPKSAIISGFIVSGILDYRQPFFVLIVFSVLAIVSKYIIRFKGRHIFNPANFGLFVASIFKIPLTWNIESNIYLIIPIGIYIAYLIKKLPHIFGFLIFFTGLFASQGMNPLMLVSWFFVFIMLIEPKTSGFGNLRGFVFGSIAGIASFGIYKLAPQYDLFIGALFVANVFNPLLERIKK